MSCVKRTEAVIHDIWWAMIASVFFYMSGLEGIQWFVHACGCIFVTAVATIVLKVQSVVLIIALPILASYFVIFLIFISFFFCPVNSL